MATYTTAELIEDTVRHIRDLEAIPEATRTDRDNRKLAAMRDTFNTLVQTRLEFWKLPENI